MAKTKVQTVRETEARKKAAGLHEYPIWAAAAVGGGGDPEVRAELKKCAERITKRVRRQRANLSTEKD